MNTRFCHHNQGHTELLILVRDTYSKRELYYVVILYAEQKRIIRIVAFYKMVELICLFIKLMGIEFESWVGASKFCALDKFKFLVHSFSTTAVPVKNSIVVTRGDFYLTKCNDKVFLLRGLFARAQSENMVRWCAWLELRWVK